jgi:hypothetical protein
MVYWRCWLSRCHRDGGGDDDDNHDDHDDDEGGKGGGETAMENGRNEGRTESDGPAVSRRAIRHTYPST